MLTFCVVWPGLDKATEAPWPPQVASHVLTPSSDRVVPVAVQRVEGSVEHADALLGKDGGSCRLVYQKNGPKPVVVLDLGKQSTGGYAVFTVTAKTGRPIVRLAYACHPNGTSETGDFTRETSARYLGPKVDLPILPANLDRYECYTIPRTGSFIAPLLQGQERYIRVQLDTPDTSVELGSVAVVNSQVYDRSPYNGYFLCSDERINRLWYLSAWTLQLGSAPSNDAWKAVDGWLLPRKLEQAGDVGLSVAGADWGDVTVETNFELRSNPHTVSAVGLAVRAKDASNAYLIEIGLDGKFRLTRRKDGNNAVLSEKPLAAPLIDGQRYNLKISADGSVLTTSLNGTLVDETRDGTFSSGRVGFYTPKEMWPLYNDIRVTDAQQKVLLEDDFNGDLSKWQFARTLSYLMDGAKRDRLPWSGDLYFAQRNAYYAFAHPNYMRDTLKMLALNQTPEGYVEASPYPECHTPPVTGDYGPFPSDEFAAWLIPVAWDHLLYTDDTETLKGIYPAITKLSAYLVSHLGEDGLFVQRAETSKHARNLDLGDTRRRAYMNILLWGAFTDAARIAERLGRAKDREDALQQADKIKRALYGKLWDEANGYFRDACETPEFGFEANALALSMGLVTAEQAGRIAPRLKKIDHGKFQSLASRGLFTYGFGQAGMQSIFDHNWLQLLDEKWQGPSATSECMVLNTNGWGDDSHADTAIADHFSAYLLGVLPTAPGYSRFTVRPQPVHGVTWARGSVPTPHGAVTVSWEAPLPTLQMKLNVPAGTVADVVLPPGARMCVNGATVNSRGLPPGDYQIAVEGLSADAWDTPAATVAGAGQDSKMTFKTSSSHESAEWRLADLSASVEEKARKGYSSGSHNSADGKEWIEMDLGARTALAKIVLLPREDTAAKSGGVAGFPRDFSVEVAEQPGAFKTVAKYKDYPAPDHKGLTIDLHTVVGYPSVRFIRLTATRLGEPAADDSEAYRLQLFRFQAVQP